jgi:hypothetical protein
MKKIVKISLILMLLTSNLPFLNLMAKNNSISSNSEYAEWNFVKEQFLENKNIDVLKKLSWRFANGFWGGFVGSMAAYKLDDLAQKAMINNKASFEEQITRKVIETIIYFVSLVGVGSLTSYNTEKIKNLVIANKLEQNQIEVIINSEISQFPKTLHKHVEKIKAENLKSTKNRAEIKNNLKIINQKIMDYFNKELSNNRKLKSALALLSQVSGGISGICVSEYLIKKYSLNF